MVERTILHVDANNFYASVECLYNPSIRGKPVAVCGDTEHRHGIILAKNYEAKKYGVQTRQAIWQAERSVRAWRWFLPTPTAIWRFQSWPMTSTGTIPTSRRRSGWTSAGWM